MNEMKIFFFKIKFCKLFTLKLGFSWLDFMCSSSLTLFQLSVSHFQWNIFSSYDSALKF